MGKKTLAEIESLARKILTTYFCDSDMEFMISMTSYGLAAENSRRRKEKKQ